MNREYELSERLRKKTGVANEEIENEKLSKVEVGETVLSSMKFT